MIQFLAPADRQLVVFTDLDGTLIDHDTYAIHNSREAITKLIKRRIPLVFCSSKTYAEQVYLQHQLDIKQPFIFENGSAAAIPTGFFPEQSYRKAQSEGGYDIVVFAHADASSLQSTLAQFDDITGYYSASDVELSAATGLTGAALQRARARWFTETLITPLSGDRADQLNIRLNAEGYVLSRGGRFYTVQSAVVNKGKAVRWMMEIFRKTLPQTPCFAAVGDSPNDVPMLEIVDVPFLVQRVDATWVNVEVPNLVKIKAAGPVGFSLAIQKLIGV